MEELERRCSCCTVETTKSLSDGNLNQLISQHDKSTYRKKLWIVAVISAILLAILAPKTLAQQVWSPWEPPWENFDPSVVVRTYYGDVRGFSVPWHIDDLFWHREWEEQPPWYVMRINCFLGIPYAQPPVGNLRFSKPRRPRWGRTWEADHFRPACPQKIDVIQEDIPDFTRANISEDCLYLNIFVPNITWHSVKTLYPVLLYIHGGDYLHGTAQQYPGQVLVTHEVVVVTFNYRLGAFGFLTTEDEHAPGNWGLWDQHLAIEFIKENIKAFRGDPNRITLMGEGAGAASVGMHLISPLSRKAGQYFDQAIMMGESDQSPFAYISPFWRPREYAEKLAIAVGCDVEFHYSMMNCLRDNKTIPWQSIVEAQYRVTPNDGLLGRVWAPTQDGGYFYSDTVKTDAFLPETPHDLRKQGLFAQVPVLAGVTAQEGASIANQSVKGLCEGMFPYTFENVVHQILQDWRIRDIYRERAFDALEFQYTYWPDPENVTARAQEYINLISDYGFGAGLDTVLRQHGEFESSYQYVFEYKSGYDWVPWCLGVSHEAIVPYVFGVPFMNETVLNETQLVARQWYDYQERNISDFVMFTWTNFAKYGYPTLNTTWNITWEPFNEYNLTYLVIDELPNLWFRYRQSKYGFWKEYFPTIALQDYLYPTATPTPSGQEYIYATGSMSALILVLLLILLACIYLLILQSRMEREEEDNYADSQIPLDFSRAQSVSTVSRRSPYQSEFTSAYSSSKC